ncbi:MAG: type II toxin-antitoxin system PemK/MazF family toxin [Flavobacteriia bacterium]|nr:type II toxin-antitoxin system PemK/MazF family toxin [Flavobacteriia bacterium]
MIKGDIVLISFPFTDLSGTKLRPAVILIESSIDLTVCFITSNLDWKTPTDIILNPSTLNGIKKTSLIRTNKIATIHKNLNKGRIGQLNEKEALMLNEKLKILLKLD